MFPQKTQNKDNRIAERTNPNPEICHVMPMFSSTKDLSVKQFCSSFSLAYFPKNFRQHLVAQRSVRIELNDHVLGKVTAEICGYFEVLHGSQIIT